MTRKNVTVSICVLGFAAALALTSSWRARAGAQTGGRLSPAGSWVVTDVLGHKSLTTVVPLDPSSSRFAMVADDFQGTVDFLGLFSSAVGRTQFRGEVIRTGPRSSQATLLAVATDDDRQVVYTMVLSGSIEITGPDSAEASATLGVYGPSQDPFGEDPPEFGCYPYGYAAQRVPVSPSCDL